MKDGLVVKVNQISYSRNEKGLTRYKRYYQGLESIGLEIELDVVLEEQKGDWEGW